MTDDDVIVAQFPETLDGICASAAITTIIANAIDPDWDEVLEPVDGESDAYGAAWRVLATLIRAGCIRGSDFVYDDERGLVRP